MNFITKFFIRNSSIVPVIMFHSVGLCDKNWPISHLSEPLDLFEEKIALLKKLGYHFVFWSELYEYMKGNKKLNNPSIMLTFDDGYLDNWVLVFPILKKYEIKATIFVVPEFVDPSDKLRPSLEDVWNGKIKYSDLKVAGFLNWNEMREMEKSGLVDIQSHTLTHTWYFCGPQIIDFCLDVNKKNYPWIAWNINPDIKPFYLTYDYTKEIPTGMPVYKNARALGCKRFFPPEAMIKDMIKYAKEKIDIIKDKQMLKNDLYKYHNKLIQSYKDQLKVETDEEYKKRIYWELKESKRIIEDELNKKVDFVCWPGGVYNSTVISIAKEVGYKAWTLSSKDKSEYRNKSGANPSQIKRVGSFAKYHFVGNKSISYAGKWYFICGIERHKGSKVYKWLGRLVAISGIIKTYLRKLKF